MSTLRSSLATKIFLALLGTIGVLLLVAGTVVQGETNRAVDAAVERATQTATAQIEEANELQWQQVSQTLRPLSATRRARALLDAALAGEQQDFIVGQIEYESTLGGFEDLLVTLSDADGRPVLSVDGGTRTVDPDPAELTAVAERVVAGEAAEIRTYRRYDGKLYSVRVQELLEGPFRIGVVSAGFPVTDEELARVGRLAGVEVCFVVERTCLAGSEGARAVIEPWLDGVASVPPPEGRVRGAGQEWAVRIERLVGGTVAGGATGSAAASGDGGGAVAGGAAPAEADGGAYAVVVVPLDPVLTPFARITRALVLGGLGALAAALLLGFALSRTLTREVRELVSATERVARGDYDVRVDLETRDEIGALADAFNDMTRGLLLKEQYRSVLDKVVSRDVAEELMAHGVELGGENRTVAVLFADLRGFTPLTYGMEPQEVIGLLNECMQRLSDAVDREGGVVDKFVGDEIMAVFGAPVDGRDDALRAVRAAVGMREAMEGLNRERRARGERALGLGVGINTGVAVAGNMGSANRLNYTVLGETVNLASRLCGAAQSGQVLVSRAVLDAAGDGVEAVPLGALELKGFARAVETFEVRDVAGAGPPGAPGGEGGGGGGPEGAGDDAGEGLPAGGASRGVGSWLLALAAATFAASPAAGQDWPTLREAGLGWISPGGTVQVDLSGQLDLDVLATPDDRNAGLARGDGVWMAPMVRLFTDVFLGDRVYALLEIRGDRGHEPTEGREEVRVEQAWVRLSSRTGGIGLQAGRFANPFGSWAGRHLTPLDPFVRPPLPYDQRTVISFDRAPPDMASFLAWQEDPSFRDVGAPPVWAVPYPWGAMVSGAAGIVTYHAAVLNSAPSSEPYAWDWDADRFERPSFVLGASARLTPGLRVDVGWNRGNYFEAAADSVDFYGDTYRPTYDQELFGADVELAWGPAMLRAEVFRDRWDVPNLVDDPVEMTYSVELQTDVAAGVSVAARWGMLDFRPVSAPAGPPVDWDRDVQRFEGSLGYRLARNAGLLVSGFVTRQAGEPDTEGPLAGARLWWAF